MISGAAASKTCSIAATELSTADDNTQNDSAVWKSAAATELGKSSTIMTGPHNTTTPRMNPTEMPGASSMTTHTSQTHAGSVDVQALPNLTATHTRKHTHSTASETMNLCHNHPRYCADACSHGNGRGNGNGKARTRRHTNARRRLGDADTGVLLSTARWDVDGTAWCSRGRVHNSCNSRCSTRTVLRIGTWHSPPVRAMTSSS